MENSAEFASTSVEQGGGEWRLGIIGSIYKEADKRECQN